MRGLGGLEIRRTTFAYILMIDMVTQMSAAATQAAQNRVKWTSIGPKSNCYDVWNREHVVQK